MGNPMGCQFQACRDAMHVHSQSMDSSLGATDRLEPYYMPLSYLFLVL